MPGRGGVLTQESISRQSLARRLSLCLSLTCACAHTRTHTQTLSLSLKLTLTIARRLAPASIGAVK